MLLLTIQMLLLMRGLRPSLSWQAHAAFVSSLWLVGASVLFMLLSAARETVLLRSFALVTLVIAVAADIFVATSAASGSIPEGMAMALLTVVMWATIWSITASR